MPTPMRARRPRSPEPDSSGHTGGTWGFDPRAAAAALGSCSVFASGFPVRSRMARIGRTGPLPFRDARRSPHSLPMSRAPLRVGVLGAGTVGRAVIDGLTQHPERLSSADGPGLCLAAVAVRDLEKGRAAGVDPAMLTDAPAHLVADPAIDVIVELIGGIEPARTLIAAALGAGKPVVTANKAVIAQHGPALEAIARRTGAALRFEAAVGGGIPVLGTLASDLAGNEIVRVRGIVNGTTNYILSAMAEDGRPYDEVLRDAQEQGLRRSRPERRRRRRRRGQQAGHPGPARVRRVARSADDRPATADGGRARSGRHHGRERRRTAGRGGPRDGDQAPRDRRPGRGRDRGRGAPHRRPGRRGVRAHDRRHEPRRDRCRAPRDRRSVGPGRGRRGDEQRGARRPGRHRPRAGVDLGRPAGCRRTGRGARSARSAQGVAGRRRADAASS